MFDVVFRKLGTKSLNNSYYNNEKRLRIQRVSFSTDIWEFLQTMSR